MTDYPTDHGAECQREPDLSLQQYYERVLRALALNDQPEFERLISDYVIADVGAFKIKRAKRKDAAHAWRQV